MVALRAEGGHSYVTREQTEEREFVYGGVDTAPDNNHTDIASSVTSWSLISQKIKAVAARGFGRN